jgi:hypothetical protein
MGVQDILDAFAVDDEALMSDIAELHAQVMEGSHPIPSMLRVNEAGAIHEVIEYTV